MLWEPIILISQPPTLPLQLREQEISHHMEMSAWQHQRGSNSIPGIKHGHGCSRFPVSLLSLLVDTPETVYRGHSNPDVLSLHSP